MIIHGAGQIINLLAPFLVAFYVIPICGVDKWGIIGMVTTVYILLGLIIEFGANLVGVKELSTCRLHTTYVLKYIGLNYNFRFICCIVLTVLLLVVFLLFNADASYFWGLTWIVAGYYNPIWIYQATESFKKVNKIIFLSKLLYVVGIYFLIKKPEDYVYVVGILGLANSIVYAYFYYKTPKNLKLSLKKALLFIQQNKSIVASNFAISFYTQAPILIIKPLLGDTYAGIYKIIDLFLIAYRSYLGVFFNVTYPKYCQLFVDRVQQAKSYLFKMSVFNLLFLIVTCFMVSLVLPYLIEYFNVSNTVKQGLKLSSLLLFLPIIIAFNIPYYQTLLFKNQQNKILIILGAALFITVILGLIFTTLYGLYGIILTLYITEIFVTLSMFIIGKKLLTS